MFSHKLAVLAVASSVILSTIAQPYPYPGPPRSRILSPAVQQEFAYGGTIPFEYKWTYDASHEPYPMVDVLIGRMSMGGDPFGPIMIEAAIGLNCKDNTCERGVLKADIDLADLSCFLGIGGVMLQTVERVPAAVPGHTVTTRHGSGTVNIKIGPLEPSSDSDWQIQV